MPVVEFPDPRHTTSDGIVAIGGDLHPDSLRLSYSQGIFPWPHADLPLLWFCPPMRAVLEFQNLHIPQRLARDRKVQTFSFTINTAFDAVIAACQGSSRPGQEGTWITPEVIEGYKAAHRQGFVHSVETWNAYGELVGGLYGVDAGGVFAGESMFYREPNASKMALLFLIDHLAGRGAGFIDIQMMTPHMKALGATEWLRPTFLDRLKQEQERCLTLFTT